MTGNDAMFEGTDGDSPRDLPARAEAAWWFNELRVSVYRYLLCNGLRSADAEEAVQETFLRLLHHLERGGNRVNIRGWIFRVAQNVARDRRKSAPWRRTVALEPAAGIADQSAGPEDQAIVEERSRRLEIAIRKLPAQQRECVLLRISGLRYREIAAVLGVNIASVGELVERAAARLSEDIP